jgi:hypothetical protein
MDPNNNNNNNVEMNVKSNYSSFHSSVINSIPVLTGIKLYERLGSGNFGNVTYNY